jgi:hypothetical protein
MKSSIRLRRLAFAVAAMLVIVCLVYVYSQREPSTRDAAGTPSASSSASGVSRSATLPSWFAQVRRPERPMPSAIKLPEAMQAALDEEPHLAQYYQLVQKVLRTQDERKVLRSMLSDTKLLQLIKEDLLAADERTYSKDAEAKRMVGVEFLSDAVEWDDNPAMDTVMETIEDVLLAGKTSSSAPDDLARSLAGDKMELYTQMLHRAPDRAALITERAKGGDIEKLLAYSKDWYEQQMRAMKADELPPSAVTIR